MSRPGWIAPDRAQVTPFAICRKPEEVIAFAETVFDASLVRPVLHHHDGKVWNAELRIGEGSVLIGEASDGFERPAFIYVHVPDTDATFRKALENGGTEFMAPTMQFYGDYDGGVEDMGGNIWWIGTHRKTLCPDEIETRARAEERQRAGDPA